MQLTLRQAHKIVEKITAHLATLDINPTYEVNIWEATDNTFDDAVEAFNTNFERAVALIEARHFMRLQIGAANFAEVDNLIAQRKLLLDRISMLRTIVNGAKIKAVASSDALSTKVAVMAQASAAGGRNSIYGSDDSVTVLVVNADRVAQMSTTIDEIQLQIETVEDKLTTANSSREHQVIIGDAVVATLRAEGIIA